MALVKKDTTGRSGIEYSNSLKRYKSNELIEYFSNVIINISNKRYFIDEQLNTILKILSILGTIRGGSLVAIKLTKLLKDLNNEQINKVIDKYIKMYLE